LPFLDTNVLVYSTGVASQVGTAAGEALRKHAATGRLTISRQILR
jgi:hypothetical protein